MRTRPTPVGLASLGFALLLAVLGSCDKTEDDDAYRVEIGGQFVDFGPHFIIPTTVTAGGTETRDRGVMIAEYVAEIRDFPDGHGQVLILDQEQSDLVLTADKVTQPMSVAILDGNGKVTATGDLDPAAAVSAGAVKGSGLFVLLMPAGWFAKHAVQAKHHLPMSRMMNVAAAVAHL